MAYCRDCRYRQKGCCAGGRLRRKRSRIDGVDRLSALSDDLLLQILARLRCARAAAHTSLLARRWRGLWAHLDELKFHHIAPDAVDAALAMSARPALSLLCIRDTCCRRSVQAARLSAWMRAAARLAAARLVITDVMLCGRAGLEVELPCFDRAASVTLNVFGARLVLPPAGHLPALESLTLDSCVVDLEDLLPRCSRLRKFRFVGSNWELDSLKIHSPTLEDLFVYIRPARVRVRCVDIVTPKLKKLSIIVDPLDCADGFTLSHTMPLVDEVHWQCHCSSKTTRFGVPWLLFCLTLEASKPTTGNKHLGLQRRRGGDTLSLSISHYASYFGLEEDKDFGRQMSQIPVTNFQVLELVIEAQGHVYGAMVLYLLGMCNFIQKLILKLQHSFIHCQVSKESTANCLCDEPHNWRSQGISLFDLEEVEIHGFKGEGHEVDLLKAILKGATMLKRMRVGLSSTVSPSDNGSMDIYHISKAYPSVEFNVHHEPSS